MEQKSFYVYSGTSAKAITASSSGTDSIAINRDSDFFVAYIQARVTSGLMLFQIRVNSGQYFDKPMLIQNLIGGGNDGTNMLQPFRLPVSMIFPAGSTVILDYTDLSASTNTVYLSFIGYKIVSRR